MTTTVFDQFFWEGEAKALSNKNTTVSRNAVFVFARTPRINKSFIPFSGSSQ